MDTIICPKCNAKFNPELSSIGNSSQCPKCNYKCAIKCKDKSILVIDDSDKVFDDEIRTDFSNNEIKKIKEIECDDYLLYYDSQSFGVQGSKGEARFPLCRQVSIAYFFKSAFLKVILRIISQFIIIPLTLSICGSTNNLMILGEVKNDVGLEIYVMFWITIVFLFVNILWLIFDYKKYGFHPEGALMVRIRFGGATNKFTFKKDKEKALAFFKQIESLAHDSNL